MSPDATDRSAVSFGTVLKEELAAIHAVRQDLLGEEAPARPDEDLHDRAHRAQLRGLAFSGGGIRSATFNLGVLQALARHGLLRYFDYLSTVSGGGYIGSWLAAWTRRTQTAPGAGETRRTDPLAHVASELVEEIPFKRKGEERRAKSSPITFLRRYSNYLTPQPGMFSLDTWTAIATYVRNMVLNLTIVVLALAFVLLLPRLVLAVIWTAGLPFTARPYALLVPSLVLLIMGLTVTAYNLDPHARRLLGSATSPGAIFGLVVVPLFAASVLLALWLPWSSEVGDFTQGLARREGFSGAMKWMAIFGGGYLSFWVVSALISYSLSRDRSAAVSRVWGSAAATAFVAGAAGGAAFWALAGSGVVALSGNDLAGLIPVGLSGQPLAVFSAGDRWIRLVTFGPPLAVLGLVATGVMHVGLMGRAFSEELRQWLSRLGAWLTILGLGWLALFATALYGAPVLQWLFAQARGVAATLSFGWIVTTLGGVLAGRSTATGRQGANRALELVARLAPYVFIAGLLASLSLANHLIYPKLARYLLVAEPAASAAAKGEAQDLDHFLEAAGAFTVGSLDHGPRGLALLLAVSAAVFLAAFVLSWRVDINEFSMHHFYRHRLVRSYLGASRRRRPSPFTGFDPMDDLDLTELDPTPEQSRGQDREQATPPYRGPYPILNTTLNLTAGRELAWQERKAASFFFTPRFFGFEAPGTGTPATGAPGIGASSEEGARRHAYRRTAGANGGAGVSLGTAFAISGAAVSPNMGYHSSQPLAFLLTVFNARLGWWMGNPLREKYWNRPGPKIGLAAHLSELFGRSHEDSRYVNLSDGGFFDNLGIYELVRRRCRFILACDAEADPGLEFSGLANAIRKCRSDLGIHVDIDVAPIRKEAAGGFSRWHCAVGRIHYSMVDEKAPLGILVYLKASLTGDEPGDVLNYAREHPEFPHESTGDQWFDESQFESYRALGFHAANEVLEAAVDRRKRINIEWVFVALSQAWHPPSAAIAASFTRHAEMLDEIFERLRRDPNLEFLDRELYLELEPWKRHVLQTKSKEPKGEEAPPTSRDTASRGTASRGTAARDTAPRDAGSFDRWQRQERAAFYLCNSMIQLMENVYLDLALDSECYHPDNRGWMNLFRHWSWSPTFQRTWAVAASTYGARFQKFCQRRLGLKIGDVVARRLSEHRDLEKAVDAAFECSELYAKEKELILKLATLSSLELGKEDKQKLPPFSADDVLLLQVRPSGQEFRFTCGIAVLSPKRPSSGGEAGPAAADGSGERKLVFFRVRPHLRNLGLGRRALYQIIKPPYRVRNVEILSDEMLSAFYRPIGGRERERFDSLFKSALNQCDQESGEDDRSQAPSASETSTTGRWRSA